MSTSSSSSSRVGGRRTVYGIPTKCWCGQAIDTWVSETKENPFRRFYRCKIARQNPTESHLFKWIDEALLDEIRIVDARRMDILQDLQSLKESTEAQLNSLRSMVLSRDEEIRKVFEEQMIHHSRAIDVATRQMKAQIDEQLNYIGDYQLGVATPKVKLAAAVAIYGAVLGLLWKIL